ncbi:MAG TPA: hydroxyacid dehydrogenase [Firmicutes bacterium]|nr:hydroxyacid dehydrogenase [Bacillota bacterium]
MKILHIGNEASMKRNTAASDFTRSCEICSLPMGRPDSDYLAAGGDAEVIIADAVAGVPGSLIAAMPNLKMIHSEGVAFNRIDLAAASEKGIYVCNCAGMNASAVAEQAVLLMLAVLKNAVVNDRAVREGRQITAKERYMADGSLLELADCTVGLIGLGDIGKCTASLLKAFHTHTVYWQRRRLESAEELKYGAEWAGSLDGLLAQSDIVSIHVPVTPETAGMCGRGFFAKMKPGAYFINTSRGELVDDKALIAALERGHLTMAGLDTLDDEPVRRSHILLSQPRHIEDKLVFSPHIAGITASSFRRGYAMIWENIARLSRGEEPNNIVNRT